MQFQTRRGIGTVVGTAFFLLILLSGFSLYMLQLNGMKNYANVINEMQELDQKRNFENVEVISVTTTVLDMLNITVRNIGSYQIHFIWLGIYDEALSSQEYYKIDFYIDPGETLTDIRNDSISIPIGEERDIQLITELGNVFSFSFPYTPPGGSGDGSSELASVTITGIGLPHNPTTWNTLAATTNISGTVLDLVDNDSNYMVFRSYPSGNSSDTTDYVDNNASDVDGVTNKGSHNNFPAQQAGPDMIVDILTEVDTGPSNVTLINQESFEASWPPSGWSATGRWNDESNQVYDGTRSADFDGGPPSGRSGDLDTPDLDASDANAIYLDFWYRDELCDDTELLLQYFDGNNWDTIADLSSTTSENQWLRYQENITDNQYFKSDFKVRWSAVNIDNNEHFYVDLVTIIKEISGPNYELDLEIQWTNVTYSELNEELAVYAGVFSGSEDLSVECWNASGSQWVNLGNLTANSWNNFTVGSYVTSSNFTVRFKGRVESGDTTQDTWDIDATLLHLWTDSDRYTAEVEFTGTSNLEAWTELLWRIDSSWDIGDVPVTIQLYDYQLGEYATSGDGYLSYVSDSSPSTDELMTQTITMNSTNFRNSTSHWKAKIKGEAITPAEFQLNIDWIELRPTYPSAGDNIQYDVWHEYKIDAITAEGDPISYGIVSIYGNGSSLSFRNAVTQTPLTNPDWVYLDLNGNYYLEVNSIHGTSERFYLRTVVGSVIGEKTITQEAP